jgi:hypothetical protein
MNWLSGIVVLIVVAADTGVLICQVAKLWFIDRMVLPSEAMKSRTAEYATWEHRTAADRPRRLSAKASAADPVAKVDDLSLSFENFDPF